MRLVQGSERSYYEFELLETRIRLYTYEKEIGVFDV